MGNYDKDGLRSEGGEEPKKEGRYPDRVEKILRKQPMSPVSTGELRTRKLGNEVYVDPE